MGDLVAGTLKCWGIIGHSNAFGYGSGVQSMVVAHNHLISNLSGVWPNLFVWTNAHGYQDSPAAAPPGHSVDEGAWLEMTRQNADSPAADHPYDSPYKYPNICAGPYPQYLYDVSPFYGAGGSGPPVGLLLPLSWHLSAYWGGQIGAIPLCIPGSLALRYDLGQTAALQFNPFSYSPADAVPESWFDASSFNHYNWYTPIESFDFQPGTGRLYDKWLAKCVAAKAALEGTGVTMDMDFVVCWLGDNDADILRERVEHWDDYVRLMVDRIRSDLVDNGLTLQPKHQVKIIWVGIHDEYDANASPYGNPDFMNTLAKAIADDDPWMAFINPSDYEAQSADASHLNHNGYVDMADDVMDLLRGLDLDPYDAMEGADRVTVDAARAKIRLKYSRSKVNTDVDDDVLLEAMNEAMHGIFGDLGDAAYWLIRRHTLTLTGGGVDNPIVLPKKVHELVGIEDTLDSTYPLNFEEVGRQGGGRLVITVPRHTTGTYTVRYLRNPPDLSSGAEKVPIPQRYLNWWYCEVCALLAAASTNPIQRAAFEAQAAAAQRRAMAKASATTRGKRKRLYTQRRLPDPMHRRRYRRWDYP